MGVWLAEIRYQQLPAVFTSAILPNNNMFSSSCSGSAWHQQLHWLLYESCLPNLPSMALGSCHSSSWQELHTVLYQLFQWPIFLGPEQFAVPSHALWDSGIKKKILLGTWFHSAGWKQNKTLLAGYVPIVCWLKLEFCFPVLTNREVPVKGIKWLYGGKLTEWRILLYQLVSNSDTDIFSFVVFQLGLFSHFSTNFRVKVYMNFSVSSPPCSTTVAAWWWRVGKVVNKGQRREVSQQKPHMVDCQ